MKLTNNIAQSIFEANFAPEGDYELVIDEVKVKSDIELEKFDDEHGNLTIVVNFSILDKEYEGYKVKSVFSIFNENNKQVALAMRRTFSTMLLSAGLSDKDFESDFDTDNLISKKVKAHVIKEPAKNNFPAYNKASYFLIKQ